MEQIEQMISILKKSGLDAWRLTSTRTRAAELYFIKDKLDMPRFRDMSELCAEVFRDFEEDGKKYRGSTRIFIEPGMTPEEIEKKIRDAAYAASFVKNPWYPLPEKTVSERVASDSDLAKMTLQEAASAAADTLLEASGDETAFINSAEIFVRRLDVRILDSEGTDVAYGLDRLSGEFVAQCTSPADVEQFRQFSFARADMAALKAKLEEGIRDAWLRAQAKEAPKAGKYDIILTGENVRTLLEFYEQRSASAMIYPQYSDWKAGDAVQGEVTDGEKLNIALMPTRPFSDEGIPMWPRPLMEEGTLLTIHGGARFASYLEIEPTGEYEKLALDCGTKPLADLRRPGTLEAVSFSDFQMDPMDGHFGGELRLGLLRGEHGKMTALSGGSINGSILASQGRLIFSRERCEDSTYEGPLAVLIPDVTVAGE